MLQVRRIAPWLIGILAVAAGEPAIAQGNLDAGKTPAQIFATTCSACHRRPQDLKRASASFMRSHYTTGSDEASAMANYLAGVASDPRAEQGKKAAPRTPPAEVPAQARRTPGEPKASEPKGSEHRLLEPKGPEPKATGGAKGRRPAASGSAAEVTAAPPTPAPAHDVKPPDPEPPPPPPAAVPPAPPPPEPFEE